MKSLRWIAIALALLPMPSFAQSDYPLKPVRVIGAFSAGGGNDLQARMVAQKLSESFKRQFVVENHSGGGNTAGYGLAAKAPADGYTLLSIPAAFTFAKALRPDLPYDPVTDFAPISLVARSPYLLLTHPTLPVKTVRDLIALAKTKPDALNMGVTNGSSTHLAAVYFARAANIKVTLIPYKGVGQVTIDTISGQVHTCFGSVLVALSHAKAGRLRALAVSSLERSAVLPQLPTISESGVSGYDMSAWNGWMAPAGAPPAIVSKLSVELARAVKSAEIAKILAEEGGEPVGSTPEQFRQLIAAEVPRWSRMVKDAGMRVE